jgi:hypothetical protein
MFRKGKKVMTNVMRPQLSTSYALLSNYNTQKTIIKFMP